MASWVPNWGPPLKALERNDSIVSNGLQGSLNWDPQSHDAEGRELLGRPRLKIAVHQENYISIAFYIEWDMIVVTVFLSILNQMEIHLVQNGRKTVTTIISHSMRKELDV